MCNLDNVTCVIKTFERPACVRRLIESVRKYYPGIRIVVADDSRVSIPVEGVTWVRLPFDVGLSAGRNAALAEVTTEWFLLMDDDFVMTEWTNIGHMVRMGETLGLDVVGGRVEGEGSGAGLMYRVGNTLISNGVEVCITDKTAIITGLDRVNNFFLGRTEAVRRVVWDEKLKLCEHTAFFWRAKGRLRVGWTAGSMIGHKQEGSVEYKAYRDRALDYLKVFMEDEVLTRCIIDGVAYDI